MSTDSGVTIIIAGEDQSGAVMDAVEARLKRASESAQAFGKNMREAGEHAVPPMIAASAVIRAADGDINHMMRSVERFLSTLPGFTAFANLVFPIIGAIAFAAVVEQGAEKLYEMVSAMQSLADTTNKAFGEINAQGQLANDELEITNDKLRSSIAKLEGKPRNGLKDAIDEARKSADELYIKLLKDAGEIEKVFQGQGFFTRLAGDQQSASDIKKLYQDSAAAQGNASYAAAQALQAKGADAKAISIKETNDLIAIQSRLVGDLTEKYKDDYAAQQASLAEARSRTGPGTSEHDKHNTSLDTRVADERQLITATQNQIRNEQERQENQALTKTHDKLESLKSVNEALRKQQELEERLARFGVGNGAGADETRRGRAAKLDDKAREDIQDELGAYEKIQEQDDAVAKEKKKTADDLAKQQYEVAREVQEARIKEADALRRIADQQAAYDLATGRISADQRIQIERSAAQQELEVKRDAAENLRTLDVGAAGTPGVDAPQRLQRDLDNQKAVERQHNAEMLQIDQQYYVERRATIQPFIQDIFQPLLDKPKSVSEAFRKMADDILQSLERIASQKLTDSVVNLALGTGGGNDSRQPRGASTRGIGGILSELGLGLFGRSKGPAAGQAGTVPTDAAAKLGAATQAGGITISVINQSSQPVGVASSSSSHDQLGNMMLSFILKDAQKLGPAVTAIGGALKMIPGL